MMCYCRLQSCERGRRKRRFSLRFSFRFALRSIITKRTFCSFHIKIVFAETLPHTQSKRKHKTHHIGFLRVQESNVPCIGVCRQIVHDSHKKWYNFHYVHRNGDFGRFERRWIRSTLGFFETLRLRFVRVFESSFSSQLWSSGNDTNTKLSIQKQLRICHANS